jgi:hypothetical protein
LREAVGFDKLGRVMPKEPQYTIIFDDDEDLLTPSHEPVSIGLYKGEDHLDILSALCGIAKRPFRFSDSLQFRAPGQRSCILKAASPQELSDLVDLVMSIKSPTAGALKPKKADTHKE